MHVANGACCGSCSRGMHANTCKSLKHASTSSCSHSSSDGNSLRLFEKSHLFLKLGCIFFPEVFQKSLLELVKDTPLLRDEGKCNPARVVAQIRTKLAACYSVAWSMCRCSLNHFRSLSWPSGRTAIRAGMCSRVS